MKAKRVIIILLSIIIAVLSFIFLKDSYKSYRVKEDKKKIVNKINDKLDKEFRVINNINKKENEGIEQHGEENTNLENVVGRLVIKKINIDYPILEGASEENLNTSIARFHGSNINQIGNCVIVGHNMRDGSFFGTLHKLSYGDKVMLYDRRGSMKEYEIFNINIVEPTDISVLEPCNDTMITLITCADKGKRRLVLQGRWRG